MVRRDKRAALNRSRTKVRELRRYLIQPGTPFAGMAIDRVRWAANRQAKHNRRYCIEIHDLHAAYGRRRGRA